MAQGDVLFSEQGILPVAHTDVREVYANADRARARADEASIGWLRDKFGALRLFTFRQNISGSAMAAGDLTSRKVVDASNQTGTATTTVVGTFTADELNDAVAIVYDDAGAAGAAPEGEASIIQSNTATTATLYTELPWSAALASGDDVLIITKKAVDAADGDYNHLALGIAMGAIADDGWGWLQFQGVHSAASHKSNTAVTKGDPVVADAATVGPHGSDAANLWVGYQLSTHGSDVATTGDKSPVIMSLLPVYM